MLDLVIGALSNSVRREIVELLLDATDDGREGLSIAEVAEAMEIDRFSASRHLGVLVSAGLATRTHRATRRIHALAFDDLCALQDWLDPFIRAEAILAAPVEEQGEVGL